MGLDEFEGPDKRVSIHSRVLLVGLDTRCELIKALRICRVHSASESICPVIGGSPGSVVGGEGSSTFGTVSRRRSSSPANRIINSQSSLHISVPFATASGALQPMPLRDFPCTSCHSVTQRRCGEDS